MKTLKRIFKGLRGLLEALVGFCKASDVSEREIIEALEGFWRLLKTLKRIQLSNPEFSSPILNSEGLRGLKRDLRGFRGLLRLQRALEGFRGLKRLKRAS